MKALKHLMLILVITVLVLTGCAPQAQTNGEPQPESVPEELEPLEGGTLKASVTRFSEFNPVYNNNKTLYQIHNLMYEGLIGFDERKEPRPVLAEAWRISEDGQSIDLTLRKDVTWHDGDAFTAEDVIFTLGVIKNSSSPAGEMSIYKNSLQQISNVQANGEHELRVTFARPFSNALEVLTFPIIPSHLFDGVSDARLQGSDAFPMVGTGQYMMSGYEKMRKFSLIRNEAYWGKKPYIKNIEIVIVPDREAQLSLFDNGEIDIAQPVAVDWAKYTDGKNKKVYEYVSNDYEFLGFNFRNQILNDKSVRKAIAYAIDRHKIVKNLYLGHGTVVDVPIQPSSWLFDDENIAYGYDVSKANQLLEEAGYIKNDKNIRLSLSGAPLRFRLLTNKDNLLREKTAFFIQDELQKVGIEVEVILSDWDELNQQLAQGSFDIVLAGWELSSIPDFSFAFHSKHKNATNFIGYASPEMDSILENINIAPGREEKLEAFKALQRHITEELPYMSLFFKNSAIAVRSTVKGEFSPHAENHFNGIEEWFINSREKEKESN